MDYNSEKILQDHGFTGFHSIRDLMEDFDSYDVPGDMKGIYLVVYRGLGIPTFVPPGDKICYGKKAKAYSVSDLTERWVPQAVVINIAQTTGQSLHERIEQYLKFGKGLNRKHRGGRAIWQIENYEDLVICWKGWFIDDPIRPEELEKTMIVEFEDRYGRKPFANRRR